MNTMIRQDIPRRAGSGIVVLIVIAVVLGLSAAAIWHLHHDTAKIPVATSHNGLSDGSSNVLKNLNVPVTIRLYSVLDKTSVPAATFAFAERVNDLLTEYQQTSNGKITVTRFQAVSDADAASADGIKPFNLDKGDACFLGLTINCQNRKESFPELSTEWEAALEADLSRAIARLSAPQPGPAAAVVVAGPAAPSAAAVADLKLALTNLADISVEDGSQILRVAAFQDYQKVAAEMSAKVSEARQHLADLQNGGSEADLQAATKELQSVEAEQMEKLKQIATQLQSRITTLEQVKKQ